MVIKFKILFQKICKAELQWDDCLSDELFSSWKGILSEVEKMKEIVIDRRYYDYDVNDPVISVFLHGFSDASTVAYGSCVYIKVVKKSGEINVRFVTAKSRVIPMNKEHTIPRLELLGNFILSNLMVTVKEALEDEMEIKDYFCWTDSQVSLAWIVATNKELKTFVQNRVEKIRKNTDIQKWSYCDTKSNPADLLTRLESSDVTKSQLWWSGPFFIRDHSDRVNIFSETFVFKF